MNLYVDVAVRVVDGTKLDAVEAAVRAVLEREEIDRWFGACERSPETVFGGTLLTLRADRAEPAIIISGFGRWEPAFQDSLERAAATAAGARCNVYLSFEFPDDEE